MYYFYGLVEELPSGPTAVALTASSRSASTANVSAATLVGGPVALTASSRGAARSKTTAAGKVVIAAHGASEAFARNAPSIALTASGRAMSKGSANETFIVPNIIGSVLSFHE